MFATPMWKSRCLGAGRDEMEMPIKGVVFEVVVLEVVFVVVLVEVEVVVLV